MWFCLSNSSGTDLSLICYGARMVWFCRNSLAHDKEGFSPIIAANLTKERVQSFHKPGFRFQMQCEEGETVWQNSVGASIKINCDESWFPSTKKGGIALLALQLIVIIWL